MQQVNKAAGGYQDMWVQQGWPFAGSMGGRPLPSDVQLMLEYLTNDLVYTCANWNAAAVARIGYKLYALRRPDEKPITSHPTRAADALTQRRLKANPNLMRRLQQAADIQEIVDHPIIDLLERDNNGLGGYQLRFMTQVYMEVFGGAYWLLEAGDFEPVHAIKLLPTQRVLALRDNDLSVVAYRYMPALQGSWIQLAKSDVMDFRFPAVEDPAGGRHAPLRSAFLQSQLAAKYAMYQNDLMDNRARIDGIFVPKEEISSRQSDLAEQLWNQKFKRGGNGRILVAENAGTFTPTRYPPTDLGPLEISRESLRRLANAFGVPEALLSKDATYANMQASLTLYARQTILPRLLIVEQKLNEMLCPRYSDRLFLAADNPVPEDAAFELQKTQMAIAAGALSIAEIRQAAGYGPVGSGDAFDNPSRAADALLRSSAGAAAT